MTDGATLLATITVLNGSGKCVAAYVGSGAIKRAPATKECDSREAAEAWLHHEAAELKAPLEWTSEPTRLR